MSQAHSLVQFSQWVQHGCSAVPAAAAAARPRHRGAFSRKSSIRRRSDSAGSELVAVLTQMMSAIGPKRTFLFATQMFAFGVKADIPSAERKQDDSARLARTGQARRAPLWLFEK